MLNSYIAQVQRFCRDQKQEFLDIGNLTDYINRARREVAMRLQCIRILTPISGQITTCAVTNGGSGYSNNPTCTITAPDFPSGMQVNPNGAQATAQAIVQNGVITAIDITYGGDGYYQPQITITDPTGTGATATVQVSPIMLLANGQEQYPFTSINLSKFPGVEVIYAVRSISVIYAQWRYSLAVPSFSSYQAELRSFPQQYLYVPIYASQLGRGTAGTLFFYPIPSAPWQCEIDAFALPSDLTDDQSYEALPQPFTDLVPFMAAYFAMLELQNLNAARLYKEEFTDWCHRHASYSMPGRRSNPYGRPFWS